MTLNERLWKTFNKALGQFQLIDEDDKILVGLSGGKDSLCLLEFLARRSKIHVPHFTVEALHVRMENIHYETDTTYLQSFCNSLGVPLHIATTSFIAHTPTSDNCQLSINNSQFKKKPACFSQAALQSRSRVRLHEDCFRPPSGRHHPYRLDESNLPRTFLHDASEAQHAQNATDHYPSSLPLSGGRHPRLC